MCTIVVSIFQVILLSFLSIAKGNEEYCEGRLNKKQIINENKKQILLKGSGNLVARYLVCGELVDEESCGNDDVDMSCVWNYEQQRCQINQDNFVQLSMDCEDVEDYISYQIEKNVSSISSKTQSYELACNTLQSISACIVDRSQQLPQIQQLEQCEMDLQSEIDFCAQANEVEIALLMINNNNTQAADLYPYHLKPQILARLLFPNSTSLQNEFLQNDSNELKVKEPTSYRVDPSPTPHSNTSGSQAQLGVLNFFLYCGLMLLLLGTAIGIFQACQMLTRSSNENACKLIVIRTDRQSSGQPTASLMTPQMYQQYYRRVATETFSADSALRNYYRSTQAANQERQPLLGSRRPTADDARSVVAVRQPIVVHSSSAFQVTSRSLNDQLWWSGQVPLQSQSNTSALEQFISSLDAYIYRAEKKEVCTVCLEDIKEEDKVVALPCCHVFHSGCIIQWIRTKGVSASCPVCNARLMDDFLLS